MDRAGRHAILGAAVLTVVAVATWRDRPAPRDAAPRPAPAPAAAGIAPPPPAAAPEAAPAPGVESVLEQVRRGNCPPLSKDVLTGPLAVEGPGRADLGPPALALSPSQQTVVEALLRERNEAFEAIRREAAASPPSRESAAALAAKARGVHEACVAAIRQSLLPDQRAAFDDLVQSGKWGGYVLVLPNAR